MTSAYDPLSYDNLARSICAELCRKKPVSLDELEPFEGSGVYAIYYSGGRRLYATLANQPTRRRKLWPIYVGQTKSALYKRLNNHRKSIEATSLVVSHFSCRYLVLDPVWMALGEAAMVQRYQPVWNVIAKGFGNHAVGAGRSAGKISNWDVLHPGRPGSSGQGGSTQSAGALQRQVKDHLTNTVR